MSGSFGIEGGQITVHKDDRLVLSTSGTLVNFLPEPVTLSTTITFPDFSKDYLYYWQHNTQYQLPPTGPAIYPWSASAQVVITALPQEYDTSVNLAPVPAGADIFWGAVSLARTVSPSHTWLNATIPVLVPQAVAVPITGSMLLEASFGMARQLSVYISGGNLIARIEQSVSVPAGGYGYFGQPVTPGQSTTAVVNGTSVSEPLSTSIIDHSRDGLPVFFKDPGSWLGVGTSASNAASGSGSYRRSGSNALSLADPTNYQSQYAITVTGRFGRRS